METATPKPGVISCSNTLVTSQALAVRAGTASSQPEKGSVNTNKLSIPPFSWKFRKVNLPLLPGPMAFSHLTQFGFGGIFEVSLETRSHCRVI